LNARGSREALPPRERLALFPMQIGSWQGTPLTLSSDELQVLGPGDFLVRDYKRATAEPPTNLYIAFFPTQRTGDTIHSPKNCLPGSGWAPIESGRISLDRPDGSNISVNRYIIQRGMARALTLYWYQARGRVVSSEYLAKIYLVADAIRLNRTDGALVRVVAPISDASDEQAAQARALEFTRQILPLLDRYIPR